MEDDIAPFPDPPSAENVDALQCIQVALFLEHLYKTALHELVHCDIDRAHPDYNELEKEYARLNGIAALLWLAQIWKVSRWVRPTDLKAAGLALGKAVNINSLGTSQWATDMRLGTQQSYVADARRFVKAAMVLNLVEREDEESRAGPKPLQGTLRLHTVMIETFRAFAERCRELFGNGNHSAEGGKTP